jgi:hypothetical protein
VQLDAETYESFMLGPMVEEMLKNHLFIDNPDYYDGKRLAEIWGPAS